MLDQEGARQVMERIVRNVSFGTGSALNPLMLFLVLTACMISMRLLIGRIQPLYGPALLLRVHPSLHGLIYQPGRPVKGRGRGIPGMRGRDESGVPGHTAPEDQTFRSRSCQYRSRSVRRMTFP
jgi:hypothetical protein